MSVTSLYFLLFLLICVSIYYIIPKKGQWGALLIASLLFFVAASGVKLALYLIVISLDTYLGAKYIGKCTNAKSKKMVLLFSIMIPLAILIVLKYCGFVLRLIGLVLKPMGVGINTEFGFLAPLGLSYFTLSAIGYIVDVYWEIIEPQTNYFKYLLFVSYFPSLTSGPLMRYSKMRDQLFEERTFDHIRVLYGFERILWGLFKKLVIADRTAIVVNTIYNNYENYDGWYIVVAVIMFALQLYTDFSGCMDIVYGASECFGIYLPENFNTPFFSQTVSEFWKRWHITMGEWFQDYILYPILNSRLFLNLRTIIKKQFGKKASKTVPTYLGLFITWICIGIWHGGQYKYIVASGLLPGFYLIMGQVCTPLFNKMIKILRINTETFSWKVFRMIRTFFCLCTSWIFVRATSLSEGIQIIRRIPHNNIWILTDDSLLELGLTWKDYNVLWGGLLIILFFEILKYKGVKIREKLVKQNLFFQWGILLVALFASIILGIYGPGYDASEFIYKNF